MGKQRVRFDTKQIALDMAERGWMSTDLARVASVSDMTMTRFLRDEVQTAKTAKKIADALGYTVRRYVISSSKAAKAVVA